MKIAFMYAGQGAQHVGMGTDFYEKSDEYKSAVDGVSAGNGSEIKEIMDNGPEELLKRTENTQPAMAAFAVGVTEIIRNAGIKPDVVCGLSIGEYGALYTAGVITAKDYLEVVKYRGKVMTEASEGLNCAMSAIIGLGVDKVKEAVKTASKVGYVTISNYNCTGQYVITGDETAVAECERLCIEVGAKQCVRLNVSGPFHTKYMEEASAKLRVKLNEIEMENPTVNLLLNVTGDYYKEGINLKDIMEQQIKMGVKFESEIKKMLEDGVDTFIEIGPGKTLGGFVKKTAKAINTKVSVYSIDCYEDLNGILADIQ